MMRVRPLHAHGEAKGHPNRVKKSVKVGVRVRAGMLVGALFGILLEYAPIQQVRVTARVGVIGRGSRLGQHQVQVQVQGQGQS